MNARPTNLEEFAQVRQLVMSREGVAKGIAFRPRPSDVVISPHSKCGTTWMQQIVHTLRTGGDMDFDDISRVVPWIEPAFDQGLELDGQQRAEPRAFKSHLGYDNVPKGCRYIVVFRDPRDALVSFFRFLEGWYFEPGSIEIADFARHVYMERSGARDYWTHFLSWWQVRDEPEVLTLTFEGMKEDVRGAIEAVANHLEIALDDKLLATTLEHSSLPFMKRHGDRFDDLLMRELSERNAGLPPGAESSKVRKGVVGEFRHELPPATVEALAALWQDVVLPATGLQSYDDVESELARR